MVAAMSGTSSESSKGEEAVEVIDMRKRKRMESNRESARRSRLRKQNHLDHLTVQMAQLKHDNHQMTARLEATTQLYRNVEAENSVLRAQLAELLNRLNSLNQIITCFNSHANVYVDGAAGLDDLDLQEIEEKMLAVDHHDEYHGSYMMNHHHHVNSWEAMYLNQPMAMDMFMC